MLLKENTPTMLFPTISITFILLVIPTKLSQHIKTVNKISSKIVKTRLALAARVKIPQNTAAPKMSNSIHKNTFDKSSIHKNLFQTAQVVGCIGGHSSCLR